jgi:methyl-accepting chemotaxis protein
MKWFLNLPTGAKIFLSFGLLILFLAAAILAAYRGIQEIRQAQGEEDRELTSALHLRDIRANQNAIRGNVLAMMLLTTQREQQALEAEIRTRNEENNETVRTLRVLNPGDSAFLSRLQEFAGLRDDYSQTRDSQVIPLIYQGRREDAQRLVLGIQEERNQKMRAIADELVQESQQSVQRVIAQSDQAAEESTRLFLLVGVLALAMSVGMGVSLHRSLANPLKEITRIAERVAASDLTVSISFDGRRDEVGVLGQTFRQMVANLRGVTQEIREGVNVLASSASEILASTTQVASGAAETATAVSQTTSTVEEVKQTAQVSSQKAKYVSESAQKSGQVSQTGKKAVEDTVAAMNRIREQVDSIAESIVRLSEQSQAIGEIIATVNDLAEQSNLLAVNASIEAAKAGEHGKGFAVVAQEVRSLAEQSKQATAQVRGILGEIQKATTAAALATEQGSKAVEAGVKQSSETGDSIRVLAESIGEAAQAATQIAASAQQQLVGMDQVALAMENIKQASAQNVASTKQAETAAQNLHHLGQKLKQLVEQYQV